MGLTNCEHCSREFEYDDESPCCEVCGAMLCGECASEKETCPSE